MEDSKIEITITEKDEVQGCLTGDPQKILSGLCSAIAHMIIDEVADDESADETLVAHLLTEVNEAVLQIYGLLKQQEVE